MPGWSVRRVWRLSFLLCAAALVVGLLAAPIVDLAGLLVAAPCCALLTARWIPTAVTALLAVLFAVVVTLVAVGGPERVGFVVAVGLAAITDTVVAVGIERRLDRQAR